MVLKRLDVDIVVVGCGVAGLSAAVSAVEAGARVVVLERAPKDERGGNTRWTEATLRMNSVDEVADDFETHFAENAGHYIDPEFIREAGQPYSQWSALLKVQPFSDPELISTFAEASPPTLHWLETHGVRFDKMPGYFLTTSTSRIVPVGGGLAIIEALAEWLERTGVDILYETAAKDLIVDEAGAVRGVLARAPDGPMRISARHVILASGGFQGNSEMLARYIGPRARYIRPVARGGYYNRGEGVEMALRIGAAAGGDFTSFHAEPIDPRSGAPESIILVFNYGILVDQNGRRFIDEAPASVDATYESITRVILQQPQGIAYTILDSRIHDVPNWRRSVRTDQPAIEADTLEELARKLGIEPAALVSTVDGYNAACAGGEGDPMRPDGVCTREGFSPRKSNWARPIDKPPFLAYPIICGNCFTFGGLKVDPSGHVLDGDGRPIEGLFAAGEVIGLYQGTYTGATSVLRGAVFGRLAGQRSANSLVD